MAATGDARGSPVGGSAAISWGDFSGPNAGYLQELYERFLTDPNSVDGATRAFFERAGAPETAAIAGAPAALHVPGAYDAALVAAAGALAASIRDYGHRAAHLDPLGSEPPGDTELIPETHGLTEADLAKLPAGAIGGPAAAGAANAAEAVANLRRIYGGTTAYDFDHVQDATERAWLRDAAEAQWFFPPNDPINPHAVLERLSEVGAFERFLNRTFPGQTRFSIEGTGMLIPMLDELIGAAAEAGTRSMLIGMAHRGRLNVLAHVLGKPHVEILEEFKRPAPRAGVSWSDSSGEAFSGDVTYHLGARRNVQSGHEVAMAVTLAPNPSHLEYVNPVIEGMARAADEQRDQPGPPLQDEQRSMPVLIHGDAAFPGQGVVAETLNLSRLPGYRTGGTIHLVVNNQLGFTVEPQDGRSTLYASDLAKGFEIPIVHVNADDPEACIAAARMAHAYRERFRKDFLVDLVGYRRWGHNEGDDPSFTQPTMYATIASHPTVRELWAAEMVRRAMVTEDQVAALLAKHTAALQAAMAEVNARLQEHGAEDAQPGADGAAAAAAAAEAGGVLPRLAPQTPRVETGIPLETLRAFNDALYRLPEGFALNPRLDRPMRRRRDSFAEPPPGGDGAARPAGTIDWGQAEALAFASILAGGTPIRITGQDTRRGTFSHRHAVLWDSRTGATYTPLHHVPGARASFEVVDSPLSESAVVGFEYGYSVQAPDALTLWEAQYGDFVNSAQVMVDQFVMSARAKWGQQPSLVLLLPHAYEGQGPEHSSARLERFLQSAAEDNVRIANCTTAAQYFHLLRRQAALLATEPRPLIVMTPKSLLRHPMAASPPADLAEGTAFQPVLDDPFFAEGAEDAGGAERERVRRVVLCSGKVFVDLAASEARPNAPAVAIVRLEQLYPFPAPDLRDVLRRYPSAEDVVWVQEEPQNMGAWQFVRPRIETIIAPQGHRLRYVGRPERASPSEGAPQWHAAAQARIVAAAFAGMVAPDTAPERASDALPATADTVATASRTTD
jgi:2-oxoglutarate dehydrogenase E1 component